LFFCLLLSKRNRLEPLNKLPNFMECEGSLLFNVNELYYTFTHVNDIQGLSDDSN